MNKHIALIIVLSFAITPTLADDSGPVEIKFLTPEQKPIKVSGGNGGKNKDPREYVQTLQYYNGWPLTIQLIMHDELGITINEGSGPFFPNRGGAGNNRSNTGFIVFSDPDGCLAMDSPGWDASVDRCSPLTELPPSDELYVEFTPDIDDIGLPDRDGHAGLRMNLIDDYSAGLTGFNARLGAETSDVRDVYDSNGDVVGEEEIVDGYGKGADDDLPGLVLVAQHGQGIVFNEDFTVKQPLELVNLAGFTNTVSYSLNDALRTSVTAQIIVPGSMFAPAAFFDTCYLVNDICERWWSIEGAAPVPIPASNPNLVPYSEYRNLFDSIDYSVSAFVVSGVGPDTVVDENMDGVIDDADLVLMGYQVLGSKKTLTFNQLSNSECFGPIAGSLWFADLDNAGAAGLEFNCGPGSGGLSTVPR